MDAEFTDVTQLGEYLFNFFTKQDLIEKGISVVITIIGLVILQRLLNMVINRIFKKGKKNLSQADERRMITLKKTSKSFVNVAILITGCLLILSFFIDVGALLAVAGVGTLAIGFGAQGLVEDVMSGFVIIFENQYAVGDYVTIDGHYGAVEVIGVRTTSIREISGCLYTIHNGKIDRMVNYSRGPIKAIVDVGIAYEEDIDKAIEVLNEICDAVYENCPELYKSKPMVFGVTQMDTSSINIQITADSDPTLKVRGEVTLRKRIKEEFDKRRIEIPYEKIVVLGEEHCVGGKND